MDFDEIMRILKSFEEARLEYILIGAVALNFHGISRTTQDLDIFVRPDPQNIERLRRALRGLYQDSSIEEITDEDLCGDYPAVRYVPPRGALSLDILTRLGEFASYKDLRAEEIDVDGLKVRVATSLI